MFAVPGWSVSSDSLKTETIVAQSSAPGTKSKKRKRANAKPTEDVTSSNVADLWETVVEKKTKPRTKSTEASQPNAKKQKQKKNEDQKNDEGKEQDELKQGESESKLPGEPVKDKKEKKDKKKGNKKAKDSNDTQDEAPAEVTEITAITPAPPKLTPLQASMRQKLISARFRHLNETLYTRPSADSYQLFADSPEMFSEYHEGFRQQVKVWPENPVDSFLKDLRSRGTVRTPGRGVNRQDAVRDWRKSALPRMGGKCVVADLGCGDAGIAESLKKDGKKLRFDVRSYDLQSPSPLVIKADIANLPLEDDSVNVAIFCLALMGTNWVDFIEEAYRVLHWKGELWVAEIKSRFAVPRAKKAVVSHSVGNRKKAAAVAKKGKDDEHDKALAVEVDGADDTRRETDVSSFVEVLKKRGFVLQGERNEAVDLSNKMFVKMHFIKGAQPLKGKGVKAAEANGRVPKKNMMMVRKQMEDQEEDNEVDEAATLKPCVYKIR